MSNRDFNLADLRALAALIVQENGSLSQAFGDPNFDASRFARFSVHHQIAGYLHTVMEDCPERSMLSSDAIDRFSSAYLQQWAKNERIAWELNRVAEAFDKAGCAFVLLKGLHIACVYYGGSDRRGISDIDLLVRKQDIGRATGILAQCGYAQRSCAPFGPKLCSPFVHAFEFDGSAFPIDLHWKLANHPSYRVDYDACWSAARFLDVEGARVCVLDPEYTLAFSLLGIAKDLELGTIRLKAFVDLYTIACNFDREGSWAEFFDARARDRTAQAATGVLRVLLLLFGAEKQLSGLADFLSSAEPPDLPIGLVDRLVASECSSRDRIWATRLYEASAGRVWGWWALSLLFRIAVHRNRRPSERATL